MRILLVDDEEQVLKGVSRVINCEEDDWEVETALSGDEALGILEQGEFDVVVSDMRMPGMDGAELLGEIGRRYPSILRIVLSGQADRDTVLRAVKPMHQYLSKPCDQEKLFEVIHRAKSFQETIKSADVLDAIGRASCIPTFPEIVYEINREIESESSTSKSVSEIVSRDPMLSARLLQLANSAIFSPRSPVSDIDRSISMIGLDMIRSIAMSQAVYSGSESSDRIMPAQGLLDHGFSVAVIGKMLAKQAGMSMDDSHTVFAAGLLHDAGKLVLLNAFPDRYKSILETSKLEDRSIQQLEMEAFGAAHQGIGGYLFGLWGLPSELVKSVASHHSFLACAHATGQPRQLVFAANWIDKNRDVDDLQEMVIAAEETEEATLFARQIEEWQEYITKTASEE
jgi:HD-like signal output (HDOD) protein/CheY-like chemotaxis protein